MKQDALPILFGMAALTGCAVGPAYKSPNTAVPPAWTSGEARPESAEQLRAFWSGFNDPVLSNLIQEAIDGNLDLQAAGQRIRAADDAVRLAASGSRPQVGLGAAAEDHRQTQSLDIP